MTARSAFGHTVAADEPTPSPITDRAGKPVMWQQTRTLTLDDNSTAYGCAHCDYVSRNVNSIRPHLSKHTRRDHARPRTGRLVEDSDITLSQVLSQLATLQDTLADRDQWKARAIKAEKSLRTLRGALGGA